MKRYLSLILVSIVSLPAVAASEPYPMASWISKYQPIPIAGGAAPSGVTLSPNGNTGQARDHLLPPEFSFRFFGRTYDRINIGSKGYISFGNNPTESNASSGSPANLISINNPRNLVAAWWGNHFCDPSGNGVRTQVLGAKPNRRYVIQWHCSREGSSTGNETTFQAQLWLYEGSDVIRASYGEVVVHPGDDWTAVAWGIKGLEGAGVLGPDREGRVEVCDPIGLGGKPTCRAGEHFPRSATIQYGAFPSVDLTGAVQVSDFRVFPQEVEIDLSATLRNVGDQPAAGVNFDLYLSRGPLLDLSAPGVQRIDRDSSGEAVPGVGATIIEKNVSTARPLNGKYYVCLVVDPDEAITEVDRSNNSVCSTETIAIGPDLVGTIKAPASGEPGLPISVPITISNIGTDRAGAFWYSILVEPDKVDGVDVGADEIYAKRLEDGVEPGETLEFTIETTLPEIIRGNFYTFVLELDINRELAEVDTSNNIARSPTKMANRKPFLSMTRPVSLTLPDGCYYGERLEARVEICNRGAAVAWGFFPGVVMGSGSQMSLLDDVAAATFPQSCLEPGSANFHACEPYRGRTPQCVVGTCRLSCESNADCGPDLFCREDPLLGAELGQSGVKSCMNFLDFPKSSEEEHCRTFKFTGKIPVTDQNEKYYAAGIQRFHFTDDVTFSLSENLPDQVSTEEYLCEEALPDFEPTSVTPSLRVTAGEITPISRRIENNGFVALPRDGTPRPAQVEFEYRYFISRTKDISIHQIPLGVVSSESGAGIASVKRKGSSFRTDLVMVPPNLSPGVYWLGLIVDPAGKHRELSKTNNTLVASQPIQVEPASLQILSDGLPTATLGGAFTWQLIGAGGVGPYSWSGGDLPPGMSLSSSGLLSGTPTDTGLFPFTVRLQSGNHVAERMLVLRSIPPQGSLEITTSLLPPAVRGAAYGGWTDPQGQRHDGLQLAASGGMGPYLWELDRDTADNVLPVGLVGPSPEGVISGSATEAAETRSITVRVRDRLGHSATRTLLLPVVRSADLVILSPLFAEGTTSFPYDSCIQATGGEVGEDYEWELDPTTIPAGLEVETRGRMACLHGIPEVCANFMVRSTVMDADGQRYTASIPLTVECELIQMLTRFLPEVARGEEVEEQLSSDAGPGASYRLYQGELPPGLSLAADGVIAGTVSEDAPFGVYSFLVLVRDDAGRQGMSALSIGVRIEARESQLKTRKNTGCSSGSPAASLPLALALAGLGLSRGRANAGKEGAPKMVSRNRSRFWASLPPALGLLLAIGAIACGETTETVVEGRCVGVSCEMDQSCDPADGICKCGGEGGVICREGQECSLEPSPHCITSRCQFVECERGESCDRETGECSCGGESCRDGQVCVDAACQAASSCEESHCSGGLSCDPADGRCKCMGVECAAGESCVEGQCAMDKCAGVNCGTNSACNSADGTCHCGDIAGPICQIGEACVPEGDTFVCKFSDLCDKNDCTGGTVCDPADGKCHCGGVGDIAPICNSEQTCIAGQCRGGGLCPPVGEPSSCEGGTSCDPMDGFCKCGGAGGSLCDDEEACTFEKGAYRCATRCEIFGSPTGCDLGEGCYYDSRRPVTGNFCAQEGDVPLDGTCSNTADCVAGLFCNHSVNRCRKLCQLSDGNMGCAGVGTQAVVCVQIPDAPEGLGYCLTDS